MRHARLFPALLLVISIMAAAGCGGKSGDSGISGADATATFNAIERRTFGAKSAVANVTIGADTLKIDGGNCRAGAGDRFFILKVGAPKGVEYLYVLMGRYPASRPAAKVTTGGGTFGAVDGVAIRHNSLPVELTAESLQVTLAADISSGTATGTTKDGAPYFATFTC
jgi:hypothetical protein